MVVVGDAYTATPETEVKKLVLISIWLVGWCYGECGLLFQRGSQRKGRDHRGMWVVLFTGRDNQNPANSTTQVEEGHVILTH